MVLLVVVMPGGPADAGAADLARGRGQPDAERHVRFTEAELPGAVGRGRDAGSPPQEGHPLTGTWAGDWGPAGGPRTHVTMVMSWDGKAVTGLINPGPASIPLTRVTVDWGDWTVSIDAEGKDAAGMPLTIRAEGRIEDVGSARRRLVGTWSERGVAGEFRLVRE